MGGDPDCFENSSTELKLNNFLHHAGTKARLFLILTWSCVLPEALERHEKKIRVFVLKYGLNFHCSLLHHTCSELPDSLSSILFLSPQYAME
jgi:hypothetical protein